MSLEAKIREALKKSKDISKYDEATQPNLYELDNFLRKSRYKLVDVAVVQGSNYPEVLISPIEGSYLYPDIIHDVESKSFQIKIENIGLIGASDIETLTTILSNSLNIIKYLDSLDLSKLEIVE